MRDGQYFNKMKNPNKRIIIDTELSMINEISILQRSFVSIYSAGHSTSNKVPYHIIN